MAPLCAEKLHITAPQVNQLFPFVDHKKNLKLLLSPVALYYLGAVFLTNCHTCFYGSQTTETYRLHAPTIVEYMAMRDQIPEEDQIGVLPGEADDLADIDDELEE